MLLNQLVEINEKGIVANAVNFSLMEDSEKNQHLCEGFIFNYNHQKPHISTVGILDIVRRSYHSRTEPNIHLMIQQYGKGKSHFAVALANFFKQPFDSPEVQGILAQIENATRGKSESVAEGLRIYKKDQTHNHLVICLSGDRGGDIKKHFLQTLLNALEKEGIQDSLAQHICSEPLRYLESLSIEDKAKADRYLSNYQEGDTNNLIKLLRENNSDVISLVKDAAKYITGFYPDFQVEVDIEAILDDIINKLCLVENKKFVGILILFDELNSYLQSWAKDSLGAGGTALQNITNICERHKGKIALLSFTQISPERVSEISAYTTQDYNKIASRLAPKDTTYEPESSLELVLSNLLIQKEETFKNFRTVHDSTLLAEARNTHGRIKIDPNQGWTLTQFHQHLSLGCFPLHPLTAYLLCNLSFTQDRTAIQFIKSYVEDFLKKETEIQGKPNYIYPIALVESFVGNFTHDSTYSSYQKAKGQLSLEENPDELAVIKAIFLYYACGDRLRKSEQEDHIETLKILTGLSNLKLQDVLDNLENNKEIIYYQKGTKLYKFFEGTNPKELEKKINEDIKNKQASIADVVSYCNSNLKIYLENKDTITALDFVSNNKLVGDNWKFEYKFCSLDEFTKLTDYSFKECAEKGRLIYILARTKDELEAFRQKVDKELVNSAIANKVVVGISQKETGDLVEVLQKIKALEDMDRVVKNIYGQAYSQLYEKWQLERDQHIKDMIKSCTYHCKVIDKVALGDRTKADKVISALLQDVYSFVPSVEGIDKMKSSHATGSRIIGFMTKQLFLNNLTPQGLPGKDFNTVIDQIFVTAWGLLKKSAQKYTVQEPTNGKVKAAWDYISQKTSLRGDAERSLPLKSLWDTLSQAPYGYNELTFTVLLAGWLVYHHKEVTLKGNDRLNLKKSEQSTLRSLSPKDLGNTDIFDKPKDFISKWVNDPRTKLIRRAKRQAPDLLSLGVNYDQAQQYLKEVEQFLASGDVDKEEAEAAIKQQQQVKGWVEQIDTWFVPVAEAEKLTDTYTLDKLLQLYNPLHQSPPLIGVTPTQEQHQRKDQALVKVGNILETFVSQKSNRPSSLTSLSDCETYQTQINQYLSQLSQIPNLPPHLSESLRQALQTLETTKHTLQEQEQITAYFSGIENLYQKLHPSSTQTDYTQTRQDILSIAANIPSSSEYYQRVGEFLTNIEQQEQELSEKLESWVSQESRLISTDQIVGLIKEIERQKSRFTEDNSLNKLAHLEDSLGNQFKTIQTQDESETRVKAELSHIDSKLQRIKDLTAPKIAEILQIYQDLQESKLNSSQGTEYQQQLENLKNQGKQNVENKLIQISRAHLTHLRDYDKLKTLLDTSIQMLSNTIDFPEAKIQLEQARQNLEQRKTILEQERDNQRKQSEDESNLQSIYRLKPTKTWTIHQCEEAIQQIEHLRSSLHALASSQTEVEQVLNSLGEKITSYQEGLNSLQERLRNLKNLKELEQISRDYSKLEIFFQESTHYESYLSLQEDITTRRQNLETLKNLEEQCKQCQTLVDCDELLDQIEQQESSSEKKLTDLKNKLQNKRQTYIQELTQIESRLATLSDLSSSQKLQKDLLQKSAIYAKSALAEQYEQIEREIHLFIELFQLVPMGSLTSLEDCQEKLTKLNQWRETRSPLSSPIQEQLDTIIQDVEASQTQMLERKRQHSQAWLGEIEANTQEIQTLEDKDKWEYAPRVLKKIAEEKSQYQPYLTSQEQETLEQIEEQYKETQILLLFSQLSQEQQQKLYEKLAEYL
jgi:hypothetical protein